MRSESYLRWLIEASISILILLHCEYYRLMHTYYNSLWNLSTEIGTNIKCFQVEAMCLKDIQCLHD